MRAERAEVDRPPKCAMHCDGQTYIILLRTAGRRGKEKPGQINPVSIDPGIAIHNHVERLQSPAASPYRVQNNGRQPGTRALFWRGVGGSAHAAERALLRRLGSWSCASPGDLTRLAKSEHRLFCARFCDVITPAEGAAKTE